MVLVLQNNVCFFYIICKANVKNPLHCKGLDPHKNRNTNILPAV